MASTETPQVRERQTPEERALARAALRRRARIRSSLWGALALAPALLLIGGVVAYPVFFQIYTAFRDLSRFGKDRGSAGFDNFARVFELDHLPRVLVNTAIWVIGVVGLSIVIGLVLAQFLNKRFPGRRVLRMIVIVPWAASVVMTSTIFLYGLDRFYGVLNRMLVDLNLIDQPYGFLNSPVSGFVWSAVVAVFVSVPFTAFVFLAGLQAVPDDVLEAAQIDGASRVQAYWQVVFPMLRPAMVVATIINVINVFNSLPILRTMTGAIPGHDADTTTTLMFKIIEFDKQIDTASALSVINFVVVLVVIGIYLRVVRPMRED